MVKGERSADRGEDPPCQDGDMLGFVTFNGILTPDVPQHIVVGGMGTFVACIRCYSDGQEVEEENGSPFSV